MSYTKAVSKVIDVIGDMVNPFKDFSELLNNANTTVAPDEITADLMQAHKHGEDAYKQPRLQRLEANPPLKSFYDTRNLKLLVRLAKRRE